MTDENSKLLVDLEVRIKQVLLLCDTLKEENIRLKTEVSTRQIQLDSAVEDLTQLKKKYDSLKTARTITAASVDVETAKVKLSRLVREVDKCINLLK
jgi:dynactin complex subunit